MKEEYAVIYISLTLFLDALIILEKLFILNCAKRGINFLSINVLSTLTTEILKNSTG